MPIEKSDTYIIRVGRPIDSRFTKSDTGARDNIPMIERYAGLVVHTIADQAFWYWPSTGTTNDDWVELDWLGGVTPRLWFETDAPASGDGNNGDIYFHDTPSGVVVYQKAAGDWGTPLGTIAKGGGGAVTLDNDVAFGTTSSDLDTKYPGASDGDIVWSNTGQIVFTKLGTGAWDYKSLSIA